MGGAQKRVCSVQHIGREKVSLGEHLLEARHFTYSISSHPHNNPVREFLMRIFKMRKWSFREVMSAHTLVVVGVRAGL